MTVDAALQSWKPPAIRFAWEWSGLGPREGPSPFSLGPRYLGFAWWLLRTGPRNTENAHSVRRT